MLKQVTELDLREEVRTYGSVSFSSGKQNSKKLKKRVENNNERIIMEINIGKEEKQGHHFHV